MCLTGKHEGGKNLIMFFFLVLALLQANRLCVAMVLLHPINTRDTTASTPRRCARLRSTPRRSFPVSTTLGNGRRRYGALLPEAPPSNHTTRTLGTSRSRTIAVSHPLFGAAETAADGHAADGSRTSVAPSYISNSGGGNGDDFHTSLDPDDVEAETQRLISLPTIDIKLELQMRGVEHRDLFEKVELARRLAESRASSSCSQSNPAPPVRILGRARDYVGGETTSDGSGESKGRLPRSEVAEISAPPSFPDGEARKEGELDELHARDVSRAIRLGKQALTRELNVMGIMHSRLSSLTFLAGQYANGRRDARAALRSFPEPSGTDEADKKVRRKQGRDPVLDRWTKGAEWGGKGATDSARASRGLRKGDSIEEEGGTEVTIQPSDGRGGGYLGRKSARAAGMRTGQENDRFEMDRSADGNADVEITVRRDGAASLRRRETSLQARADSMSSRELMSTLDALGVRYRIPAPRVELQATFVSAVLESRYGNGDRDAANARDAGQKTPKVQRSRSGIVSLDPYAGEEGEVEEELRRVGFDSYNSALRWARQLTFDDVLDELGSRGLQHDPKAGFGSLTRTLAEEVLAEDKLLDDVDTKVAQESELEQAVTMSAQEIIRSLREGGEQVDATSSQEELAEKFVAMNLRQRGASRAGSDWSRRQDQTDPYGEGENSNSQPRREDRWRGGKGNGNRRNGRESSSLGAEISDWSRLGDEGRDSAGGGTLLELEEAVRSVGGAVWRTARETGSLFGDTAAGLFPEVFPEGEAVGAPTTAGVSGDRGRYREGGAAARARSVRGRAGGARRAAASFAQSSANRAGLAVTRSAANGFLRGAEAAADWAGGGALAREYVLLIVAGFCLVFKRGIGASIALLFLIRAGRIALQRLVTEGRAGKRSRRVTATAGASSGPGRAGGSFSPAASGRRGTMYEREDRRRPRQSQASRKQRSKPKTWADSSRVEGSKTKMGESGRRRPLWDESEDDSDRGCVVM